MAYKPTTGTSILDNDFRLATSEGVYEALQLKQDALPSQSGNEDKVLVSDGSDLSWQFAGLGAGNFGTDNVILGRGKPASLTGTANTIIGDEAGNSLTSGVSNNFFGTLSGFSVTTGSNSNYFGTQSGRYATGNNNTFVGHAAGRGAPAGFSGINNLGIGYQTLLNATTTVGSAIVGVLAGQALTSGNFNTFIGFNAGNDVTTGAVNVLIGAGAGDEITTGGNNVIIGDIAGSTTLASTMIFAAGTAERFRVDSSGNMGIGTSSPTEKLDVSGNVKANSAILTLGTVSAPAYSFTGDTNTGMWSSGADTLNFSTNSNERIRITSAGLVGIGTTSPSQALTVVASSSGAIASLRNTAVAGYSAMSMFNNSGAETAGFGFANASASLPLLRDKAYLFSINRDLLFTYNYSTGDGIIIKNGGNVGIGTLTPGEKLEVNGNVKANSAILNGATSGNITLSAADTTTSYSVKMPAAQGSADMLMHNDGSGNLSWNYAGLGSGNFGANNVILGRDKPAGMTGVSNILINLLAGSSLTSGTSNNFIGLWAGNSTTTGNNNNYFGVFAGRRATGSNNTFMGHGVGVGAVTGFTGSNNVGFGNYCLQNATSAARVTALGQGAGFGLTSGSDNVLIGKDAGVSITTGNSNLVIGTVYGSAALASTMIFAAGTAERFRVDSSGNMGIGTSTPGEKLEVAGAVLATEYRVPNYRLDPHTHDEGTETGNFTINWSNGAVHTVTLNAAGPLVVTMNNPVNGGAYALRIIQGATPGTVTWPANVKWPGGTPPTLSSGIGAIDIVNFLYFDDGGGNTFYYGTIAQDFA